MASLSRGGRCRERGHGGLGRAVWPWEGQSEDGTPCVNCEGTTYSTTGQCQACAASNVNHSQAKLAFNTKMPMA
jgi:hypothetical protein